jgi:hypothetical protein
MGLENRQTCIYLTIMHGKIVRRVPEGTAGAEKRINKMGETVSEVFYDAVEGMLSGVNVFKHEQYGSQWTFDLVDGGDTFRLQLPEGGNLSTLLTALPTCKLDKPIKIVPYEFTTDEGKLRIGVSLRQENEKVGRYFTKDNPKGLPKLKQVEFAGKTQWDSYDRYVFLEKFYEDNIIPKLSGAATTKTVPVDMQEASDEHPF